MLCTSEPGRGGGGGVVGKTGGDGRKGVSRTGGGQRRCEMPSPIVDSACPFCIGVNAKKGTLSQHFVMHVVPPLGEG